LKHLQAVKETVYAAVRNSVRAANPQRVATIAGVERTAVALEGVLIAAADRDIAGVFYVSFPGLAVAATNGAVTVECDVRYSVAASQVGAADLEQAMSSMDEELLVAAPGAVSVTQQTPGSGAVPVPGMSVTWEYPVFAAVKVDGARWRRTAKFTVTVVNGAVL